MSVLPDWVDAALKAVVTNKASDLYLSVGMPPSMRLQRQVRPLPGERLTPAQIAEAVEALCAGKQIDGLTAIDGAYSLEGVARFRLHAFRQRGSWSLVARLIPTHAPSAAELGIPPAIVSLVERKQGLVLVTGATGSGKSTTLAALVRAMNERYPRHIVTIEDPVEYLHGHLRCLIDQREVGEDVPSYARGLHDALREAADVIVVGELRDTESMRTALHAAETGHLVLSTLHTASAVETIDRLLDAFPADEQPLIQSLTAAVLLGVVSQQLLPRLQGSGMIAAFDILLANNAVKALIRKGQTAQLLGVQQTATKDGMMTIEHSLAERVQAGLISRETALQATRRPEELASLLAMNRVAIHS